MNLPRTVRNLGFIAIAFILVGCATVTTNAVTHPATSEGVVISEELPAQSTAMIPTVSTMPESVEEAKVEESATTTFDPNREAQIECLAKNIYFEARGESRAGQMAVGQVTINRAKSDTFPPSICAVVKQRLQFSWYWDKIADVIRQPGVYAEIHELATKLYDRYWTTAEMPDIVNGATHFHTTGVRPGWKNMVVVARIDNHIFLRSRKR